MTTKDRFFSTSEVAGILHYSTEYIRILCKRGIIAAAKVTGTKGDWRITATEVERLQKEGVKDTQAATTAPAHEPAQETPQTGKPTPQEPQPEEVLKITVPANMKKYVQPHKKAVKRPQIHTEEKDVERTGHAATEPESRPEPGHGSLSWGFGKRG